MQSTFADERQSLPGKSGSVYGGTPTWLLSDRFEVLDLQRRRH